MKRICSICEAGCGLVISADGREVVGIESNQDDVFSQGHICAKGIALKELDADPDRLRTPLVRKDGALQPASWPEAFAYIAERLNQVREEFGSQALGAYIGNPSAHNVGLAMGMGVFLAQLGSTQIYSAGTVDQIPKHLASMLMFGNENAIPVPDITHSDFILMLGANPVVSNGSLWMVPGFRQKLRDFAENGGQLVTVDPRRTETARLADDHFFIRPGTDAYLLAALINLLVADGFNPSGKFRQWHQLKQALAPIDAEFAEQRCGISAQSIRSLANRMGEAKSPAVYGRVGTTLQQHGTLTSFLVEVLNLLLGTLDQPGGAMFPEQPFAEASTPKEGLAYNRWQSRVGQYPEVMGQLPCAALAEEMETPGEGQIKALFCFAGNPVVSNPDSDRLAAALDSLELLVCTDIYHNETTSLADVVLPGTSPFEDSHYDSFLGSMGWRNSARYSPPLFEANQPREWDIGLSLAYIASKGKTPSDDELRDFEDTVIAGSAARYADDPSSPLFERDVQELVAGIGPEQGVERLLDLGIRAGRWGDHFGQQEGLTLKQMIDTPDGIDLGELRGGRLEEMIQHPHGEIELAPQVILDSLNQIVSQPPTEGLRLIGRRQAFSNNSWLGNLPMLNKSKNPCPVQIHAEDAAALGISDQDLVRITSNTGSIEAEATITDDIMRGCISMPHGFSDTEAMQQSTRRPGANYNRLAAAGAVDKPSGTSALNGIEVSITKQG